MRVIMQRKFSLNYLFATFFFTGYFPFAPGTIGTIAGMAFWLLIPINSLHMRLLLVIATFITGVLVSGSIEKKGNHKDPGFIVIDEVVGIWITLMFVAGSPEMHQLIAAFFLFRFFDITKLPPIKFFEKLKGGYGIMLDDVVAGLLSGIILFLLNNYIF